MPESDVTPDQSDDEQVFQLGLTMAGAISAGAYTAGVLETLLEALDRHNWRYELFKKGDPDPPGDPYPRHRVVLRVISGTSAGGMSGGLGIAGLIDARASVDGDRDISQMKPARPVEWISATGYRYSYSYRLKPLHNCWITGVDLLRVENAAGGEKQEVGLLTNDDLEASQDGEGDPQIHSLLNTSHIDTVINLNLKDNISWRGNSPYGFIADKFDLFLTTTNLQGIPYKVRFNKETDEDSSHSMAQHSSVRHFRVGGLGDHVTDESAWLDKWKDRGIAVDVPENQEPVRFVGEREDRDNWVRFGRAAVATGAFPVGLAARPIDATADEFGWHEDDAEIAGGAIPISLNPFSDEGADLRPDPDVGAFAKAEVNYVAVDGGVINNEPFELARFTLRSARTNGETDGPPNPANADPEAPYLQPNARSAIKADRAVIMVDPFPEGPAYTPMTLEEAEKGRGVLHVAKRLLPTLISQARFKPGELIEAASPEVHSRFLIAPKRRVYRNGEEVDVKHGADAIASGGLGGFGGFIDRGFRAHDFMLGRMNAHGFIARRFNISAANTILGEAHDETKPEDLVPIIQPGKAFLDDIPAMPDWPRIGLKPLDPILAAADSRVGRLLQVFLDGMGSNFFARMGLRAVAGAASVRSRLSSVAMSSILSDLIARDQLEEYRPDKVTGKDVLEPWQRRVLTAIAGAGSTPLPIMRRDGEPETVPDMLSLFKGRDWDGPEINSAQIYHFVEGEAGEGRLWKAPKRAKGDNRYMLERLKPKITGVMRVSSAFSRAWSLIS